MALDPARHCRALIVLLVGLGAFVIGGTAHAASQIFVWPTSGWNTTVVYPSGSMPCLTQTWQHSVAAHYYDDRVSSPNQLWIDYYDVYDGEPSEETLQWAWMAIVDGANPSNSGFYTPPVLWAIWRDWTVWPQRSFGYVNPNQQVYVETKLGLGGGGSWCGGLSRVVFRH